MTDGFNPLPYILIAETITFKSVDGGQEDDETSKVCLHSPSLHEETGMVAEPQFLPEVELEYIIV